mmetsp:Transcript_24019/g.55448  ORF Transcript_24019/g.55448 Transcript_24019/m.55448 type:complete len:228 (-) Transcript_24019:164-847(-)
MFACTACKGSDPTTSTVKVDPKLLEADKENVAQNVQQKKAEEQDQQKAREREIQERKAEEERRREAERKQKEQHRLLEQERIEKERREAEAEQERRREAERARVAAEEDKRRQEEQQRAEMEEQETKREEQAKADAETLNAFLASKSYGEDVNARRKTMRKHYYPLHDAVTAKDEEAVRVLLAARADPTVKSSSGKTPLDRAKKSNIDGSLATIVDMLTNAMPEQQN